MILTKQELRQLLASPVCTGETAAGRKQAVLEMLQYGVIQLRQETWWHRLRKRVAYWILGDLE